MKLLAVSVLLLILVPPLSGVEPGGVTVEGIIVYTGPLPKPVPVPEAQCERHLIERDAKTNGLRDAVVWIEGMKAPARKPPRKAVMDQRAFAFVPHVLAIEAGQEVEFLNSDGANHGVLASSSEPRNAFNLVTPPAGSRTHRFVSCRGPVRLGCPIHASMAAWIFVFDHPFFAVTDAQGKFRLPPLPPGKYRLEVRHPTGEMRRTRELIVEAGKPTALRIELVRKDAQEKR